MVCAVCERACSAAGSSWWPERPVGSQLCDSLPTPLSPHLCSVGSTQKVTQDMWVLDPESSRIVNRKITFVPGLFKIFDEILVNAADNKVSRGEAAVGAWAARAAIAHECTRPPGSHGAALIPSLIRSATTAWT